MTRETASEKIKKIWQIDSEANGCFCNYRFKIIAYLFKNILFVNQYTYFYSIQIMSKSIDKEQKSKAKINKLTQDITEQIDQHYQKIRFTYENSFVSGTIHEIDLRAPELDYQMMESLPKHIRNHKVWKLEIKAIQNYKDALARYVNIKEKQQMDKKNIDDELENYDDKSFKILKVYLTEDNILFGWEEKSRKSINIGEYKHIFIQDRNQYEDLKKNIANYVSLLKNILKENEKNSSFLQKIFSTEKEKTTRLIKESLQTVHQKSFFLTQKWHETDIESRFRIICIYGQQKVNFSNFYVYYNTIVNNDKKELLQSLQLATKVKDQLVLAHMTQKHKQNIKQVAQSYHEATKNKIFNNIVLNGLNKRFIENPDEEESKIKNTPELLQAYRKQCIEQFARKWREKAHDYEKYATTCVLLEIYSITIPKSIKAKSIVLYVDKKPYSQMKYSSQDQYSWYFKTEQVETIAIDLDSSRDKLINFEAVIEEQGKLRKVLINNVKINKIQNQALGFAYELGLVPKESNLPEGFKYDFPYVLIFDAIVSKVNRKRINLDVSVRRIRQINLLSKIGKIPNLYSSYFKINYHPSMIPIVSEVLDGRSPPLNKSEFEKSYLSFLHFFQHEENRSQNFCLYLKMNKYKLEHTGYLMKDRLSKYSHQFKLTLESVSKRYEEISGGKIDLLFKSNIDVTIRKSTKKKDIANLKNDIEKVELFHKQMIEGILKRYILFCDHYNKRQQKKNYHLGYHNSLIKIADMVIQLYQRSLGGGDGQQISGNLNFSELLVFFTAFMLQMYPYHKDLTFLQNDLYHIRVLVQKYLNQFNYRLNRSGKGLQNYVSNHFLGLFTNLPREMCYRIWDFMIAHKSRSKNARIIIMYTLLLYQQKAQMTPIYPINQLIESMEINIQKIQLDQSQAYHFNEMVKKFSRPIKQRKNKILDYAKQKYLKRFCFGRAIKEIELLDEDQIQKPSTIEEKSLNVSMSHDKLQHKLLSLNELNYPLPSPNHQGTVIKCVYILIGGVFILKNINFYRKKYKVKIQLSPINNQLVQKSLVEFEITDKAIYLNEYFKLPYLQNTTQSIEILLLEDERTILKNAIMLANYHKDQIYKENVPLQDVSSKYQNNLGRSLIQVTFILRNQKSNQDLLRTDNNMKILDISQKLLDYDLQNANNTTLKAMRNINKMLNKILDPLDQLNIDEYPTLKFPITEDFMDAQWLRNSRVTIQELNAILNSIFTDDSQKNIRLKLHNIYEEYSQNFQHFSLGRFIVELILITPISTKKKLNMLFCICTHYQNVSHPKSEQKITIETLNSLIREIYSIQGILNSCPYSDQHTGEIVSAYYYEKGEKVEEKKRQITDIIQDWAAITRFSSKSSGLLLGSATTLSVLKSMFPANILEEIEQEQFCRFEIIYRNDRGYFVWSATVRSSNFEVVRRGMKFLNSYPKYNQQIKYFDSIGEVCFNLQNYIPLQSTTALSHNQFCEFFTKRPFLTYLLGVQPAEVYSQQTQTQKYPLFYMSSLSRVDNSSDWNKKQKEIDGQYYSDYAIIRHQNCYTEWRKCRKIRQEPQSSTAIVQFLGFPGEFQIPVYELISMDQNLNDEDNLELSSVLSMQ